MKTIATIAAMLLAAAEAAEWGYSSHSYPSYHSHSHSHSHDDDDDDVDKSTWYNKYQQYSTPKIAYKPTTGKKTEYAVCEVNDTSKVQLAQMPGKAVQAKVTFDGLSADTTYAIRVTENGTVANGCINVGDEYNPLAEKDSLGRVNPYADPTRGRIANFTTDGSGVVDGVTQKDILLNLLGYKGIMGRSLTIYATDSDGVLADIPTGCCVIGYDERPETTSSSSHHHHGYGYGSGYGYKPSYKPSYRPSYSSYRPSYGGYGSSKYGYGW